MLNKIAQISDLPLPNISNEMKLEDHLIDEHLFDNIGYVDPNSFLNETDEKDKSMDIYSLGSLLWEIMSEKVPYSKDIDNGIYELIFRITKKEYREKDIDNIPNEYIALYKKC